MKRIFTLLTLMVAMVYNINAQITPTIVYHERFDAPSGPDSLTTYNTSTILNSAWNDTNQLFVSPSMSYHTRIVPFDSVIFETTSFSTLNNTFVRLKFNHICKIFSGQRGYIQASNNGGTTWVTLNASHYRGASPQFGSNGYFNELSYPAPGGSPYWGGVSGINPPPIMPTNQWWAQEIFNLSAILGGTNGYANCKIRFIAAHAVNVPINPAGWYVDNMMVEAAPCELFAPTFTYTNPAPLAFDKPVGARYLPTQSVNIKVRDEGMGVKKDSISIFWRVDGGAWQSTLMIPSPSGGPACRDSIALSHMWSGIVVGDTIDWYIKMYDCACPNETRDPLVTALPNYYTFWRDIAPPLICGNALPNSFPLVVSSLPYIETFESSYWVAGTGTGNAGTQHRGNFPINNPPVGLNWKVEPSATANGFAWSVRQGNTGTAFTGPIGNHTPGGNKYLYTEASQGNASQNVPLYTYLTTPCIDLSSVNCAALEFYYHMYGSDIDRLIVDIDTGSNTSKFVPAIWQIVGQQHNSESAPFTKAFVSLDAYVGKIVRLRFSGRKNTVLNNDRNDIAIDDIRIFEPTPVDISLNTYLTPKNGFCGYSATEEVKVCFQTIGCQTLTAIPFKFKVEYTPVTGPPTTTVTSSYTLTGSFPSGKDSCFTFVPKANLSQFGTYRIWVYSDMPGDTIHSNDTIGPIFIEHNPSINTFPYILDFDGPGVVTSDGTPTTIGTLGPPYNTDWTFLPNPLNNDYAWRIMTGKTPSVATGPRTDYSGKGNYIYTEGNYGVAPINALFASKCINLTGLAKPTVDFMYHFYGADGALLRIQVVPSGSNNWVSVPASLINSQSQTSSLQQWKLMSVDLSAYLGQTIKIRFVGQKSGNGNAADIALDNIVIYNKIATDVSVEDISFPGVRVNLAPGAPAQPPVLVLRNRGSQSVTGVPVTISVTPLCGPTAGVPVNYTATFSGTIAAGATANFTVSTPTIVYPVGDFEICATTNKTGDTYTFNNKYCMQSVGWPQVFIQSGFSENFDGCSAGNARGFFTAGDYRTFLLGTPTGGASSAPNAFSTQIFGNDYNKYQIYAGTNEYLFTPIFIGFDTIVGAELSFRHKFNFGTNGVGVLERQNGAVWEILGIQDITDQIGFNWYKDANLVQISGGSGWVGNSASLSGANTQGWVTSKWPLNLYNYSTAPLALRFRQVGGSGGGSGWSIDDISITVPPQNSTAPVAIDSEGYFLIPDVPNDLQVKIENTGAKAVDSVMVTYKIDNLAWTTPQLVVFSPKLGRGVTSDWIKLNAQWINPPSGAHNVNVATFAPNNKKDNFQSDDTLKTTLVVLDKVVFTATDTTYCNSFEDPTQNEWIAYHSTIKSKPKTWQKGSPAQAPIVAAHSGSICWMTDLTANYTLGDNSSLFTPVFFTDSGQVYEMSFWHNFKTELYHDGGGVDVSFDGGKKWITVGRVLPNGKWYNTTHVTSLDVLHPGWTGESNGWVQSKIKLQFDSARTALFRFRFGADLSFEYAGWAIDDFCFGKASGGSDQFIGVDEGDIIDVLGVGNIIPNPSNGATYIPYVLQEPRIVKTTVYSLLGQPMITLSNQGNIGVNQIDFDVTGWSAGMYLVTIEVDGSMITKKMVVK